MYSSAISATGVAAWDEIRDLFLQLVGRAEVNFNNTSTSEQDFAIE